MLNAARDALRGDSMLGREERQAAEAAVDVVGCVRLGRLAGCNTAPALQLVFSTWAAGLFGRLPRFSGTPFCTSGVRCCRLSMPQVRGHMTAARLLTKHGLTTTAW